MATKLDQLLQEADQIIATRAAAGQEKTASADFSDEDIFALAEQVKTAPFSGGQEKRASAPSLETTPSECVTVTEKLAHAFAMVETFINIPHLQKMMQFEKSARERGHSDEEISDFIEKQAGKSEGAVSLGKVLLDAGLMSAGGAGGYAIGEKKGTREGARKGLAVGYAIGRRAGESQQG